jgi:hypothetical protein
MKTSQDVNVNTPLVEHLVKQLQGRARIIVLEVAEIHVGNAQNLSRRSLGQATGFADTLD